jgi:hypothetical protein
MLCRRRCPDLSWFRRADPRGAEREPAIVRLTLEDLQGISLSANRMLPAAALWNPIRAMSPENRREYINNVLVSRVSRLTSSRFLGSVSSLSLLICCVSLPFRKF